MMDRQVPAAAIERAVALATEARGRAYAPYSGFLMGAGIIGRDGREVSGTLVENVSLGLAMCSERVALFTAVQEQVVPIVLALSSARTEGQLTFPCGACLQVALEIAGPELLIVAVDEDGIWDTASVGDLLPHSPRRFTALE